MKPVDLLKAPFQFVQLAGGAKSFEKNMFIGSERLNRAGLHGGRVRLAAEMAQRRRLALGKRLSKGNRTDFQRDGFVCIPDFLPQNVFDDVRRETDDLAFDRFDMRQGSTVTRRGMMDARDVTDRPGLAAVRDNRAFKDLVRYVASHDGEPLLTLQVVMALPTPDTNDATLVDPQTVVHSDTFHATAKAWLFLKDVGEEDGPFSYVRGSHIVTPERLEWENAIAQNPSALENVYSARGSLRATLGELDEMNYPAPTRMMVAANTLVVADTHGFHARCPSSKRTTRMEIYASLRRNPFLPWSGLHYASLPGIRGRTNGAMIDGLAKLERLGVRKTPWHDIGRGKLDEWPAGLTP